MSNTNDSRTSSTDATRLEQMSHVARKRAERALAKARSQAGRRGESKEPSFRFGLSEHYLYRSGR